MLRRMSSSLMGAKKANKPRDNKEEDDKKDDKQTKGSAPRPNPQATLLFRYRLSEEVSLNADKAILVFAAKEITDLSSPLLVCTKIPTPFLEAMLRWSSLGFMLSSRSDLEQEDINLETRLQAALSKRSNHMPLKNLVITAKDLSIAQEAKDGGHKSKIASRQNPDYGNISYSDSFVENRNAPYAKDEVTGLKRGYNLLDNSKASNFSQQARNVPEDEAGPIKNAFKTVYGSKILEVRAIGRISNQTGLYIFSEEVPRYRKAAAASNRKVDQDLTSGALQKNTIHFIQRHESLHSILKRIARGVYVKAAIENNRLVFSHPKIGNSRFGVRLHDIMPAPEGSNFKEKLTEAVQLINLQLQRSGGRLNLESLTTVNRDICVLLGEKIFSYYCAMWELKSQGLSMPVVVRAGEDGYAIASDVDILQIPGTFDLPDFANVNYVTSMGTAEDIRQMLANCATDISNYDFNGKEPSALAKIFIEYIDAAYDFYSALQDHELKLLGTNSAYSMVMQYYFNEVLNVKGLQGTKMWLHGPESSNPGPEMLDAAFSVWNNNFFYTGTEREYIHYLLHDENLLKTAPLAANAAWLSGATAICREMWADVIEIQALYCLLNEHSLEKYFAYLHSYIDCPQWIPLDPMPEVRTSAGQLLDSIRDKVRVYAH
jgi:hypothetical protein